MILGSEYKSLRNNLGGLLSRKDVFRHSSFKVRNFGRIIKTEGFLTYIEG
jgi:hypothetical protein